MLSFASEILNKILIQPVCLVRLCRLYEIRSVSFSAVGIQRKLRNYQYFAAYTFKVEVYLVILIGKYPQSDYLISKSAAFRLGVLMSHTEQQKKTRADLSDDLAVYFYTRIFYSLKNYLHFYPTF